MLTLLEAKRDTNVLPAREIPAAAEGRIRVNVANALAATAAAIGADVELACIRDALRAFSSAYGQTPGRFNLLWIEGKQVVVDYCHNVHGLMGIADFVRRTAAPQSIAVIAVAGDRRDEDIRAFGELAGRTFDRVVIREHDDPRGRQRGEVAHVLHGAVVAAGLPEDRITVVLDEVEAANAAVDLAAPGALVVIMAYRIPRVWEALARRAAHRPEPALAATRDGQESPDPARVHEPPLGTAMRRPRRARSSHRCTDGMLRATDR